MCGICGYIHLDNAPASESVLAPMMKAMKHRGPDDEGVFVMDNMALGFVRLSIIDLTESGHQPMTDQSGNFVILFNGEIYNYIELREELQQKGYAFSSSSDTEVLLCAYIEWGDACLDRLNGMFAFVVFNRRDRSLFIARDRFGIKPLYYYRDDRVFIFASEIPPILKVYGQDSEADKQSVYNFLAFNRTDQTENTFFQGINKLQHGHKMFISDGRIRIDRWYLLEDHLNKTEIDAEEYLHLLQSAIEIRLRSDVPLGVCLSGGIDSSTIVSTIYKTFNRKDLATFSAVYRKGQRGDESAYINEFRNELQNMYFTRPDAGSLFNDQHSFMKAHAEPFPTTAIYAQYKVMELAKDKVKVLLDGQGADEQLAGYHYFFGYYFAELLRRFRLGRMLAEQFHYLVKHRSSYAYMVFLSSFISNRMVSGQKQKQTALHRDFTAGTITIDRDMKELIDSRSLNDSLLNHFRYKLEHLLKWEDRNSMWFSIESRVPFLDYRLVEATLSQAPDKMIKNGTTKVLLRDAVAGIIPEKIRNRKDKIGFQTPEDDWFRESFYSDFIMDVLHSSSFKNRGIIDVPRAVKGFQDHLTGKVNLSKEIWKWLNLELWYQEFID